MNTNDEQVLVHSDRDPMVCKKFANELFNRELVWVDDHRDLLGYMTATIEVKL